MEYDLHYQDRWSQLEDQWVANHLANCRGHVLDIACGTGLGRKLLNGHESYTGIDIDHAMLKRAQQKYPLLTFLQHDMNDDLPFEDNCFDTVISIFGGLSFSKHPQFTVNEIIRVSKPGAMLFIMTLGQKALWRWNRMDEEGRYVYRQMDRGDWLHFYTLDSLQALFSFPVQVMGVSCFGLVCEWSPLWGLDRLLSERFPNRCHSLAVKAICQK